MQNVDISELKAFDDDLQKLLEAMPELRREMHEQIGRAAKQEVDLSISGSGVNDGSGKVRGWQKKYIGSLGGYAAVRSIGSKDGASTGRNSPGAITNYLENGHAIRKPSGKRGYRPRIRVVRVRGYQFYQAARTVMDATAIQAAEEFADKMAERMEGRG